MQNLIITTKEELEDIINKCLLGLKTAPYPEQKSEKEELKHLHSIRELADFLGCSIVTAQKLKNSGRIRYKQFGRKVVFVSTELLEDLNKNSHKYNNSNNYKK
jgi:hypothetical protein